MFERIRRRVSPATAIAGNALFVALSGTAVAQSGILISSPDQLASNVVTSSKIASESVNSSDIVQEAVSDFDLRDPQLKVRALSNGSILPGSDGSVTRTSTGTYNVTFNAAALNAAGGGTSDTLLTENCAFSATARNKLAMMHVDGPVAGAPNTVRVEAAFPQNVSGGVLMSAVDTQFDVLASC
jgi:hypothetical protein